MLKAWDFTKNKLCHICFDNNLKKIFGTSILENDTGQILLTVVWMVGLWLKLQIRNSWLKLLHLYLPSILTHLCLNFKKCNVSICRGTSWPGLASKNILARMVDAFKLTLLTIFVKSTVVHVWKVMIARLACSTADN